MKIKPIKPITAPLFGKKADKLVVDDVFEVINQDLDQYVVLAVLKDRNALRFQSLTDGETYTTNIWVIDSWRGYKYIGVYKRVPRWLKWLTLGTMKDTIIKPIILNP